MSISSKKLPLFLVLLVAFIDWVGLGLVYPMFSAMLFQGECTSLLPNASAAFRGFILGILLAGMPIGQFFSAPILGALSDHKGRKKLIIYSLLIGVIGYLVALIGVVYSMIWVIMLSRLIVGFSAGNAAVVSAAIADLSTAKDKVKNFGLFSMACGVGFTIGPFLGGQLSEIIFLGCNGFAVPFLFAALATLINMLLVRFFFKETLAQKREGKVNFTVGFSQLKKALHTKGLRPLFLAVFVFIFGWSFYYEFMPVTWIANYGIGTALIGMLYAWGSGFYALSSGLLIRPFVSRFKPQKVFFFALVGGGVSILLVLLNLGVNWLWFFLPLQNFLLAFLFSYFDIHGFQFVR